MSPIEKIVWIFLAFVLFLILIHNALAQVGGKLVNGTFNTYTDGTYIWAGNPYCVGQGYNYTLQPTSPAIDAGVWVEGINCPAPGPGPAQNVGYCQEWYGQKPDIGACEFVPQTVPQRPTLGVLVQ